MSIAPCLTPQMLQMRASVPFEPISDVEVRIDWSPKAVTKKWDRNKFVEPHTMRDIFSETSGATDKPNSHNISD